MRIKALIITAMRNEAPYILEWISYHLLIGFDHFVIVSNDCEDGTDLMLDALQKIGIVTHVRHDKKGAQALQWRALRLAEQTDAFQSAEWLMVQDVDEFLNIKAGQGHLQDLFAARPEATGFMIQWRLFGNNATLDIHDQPVIRQFTKAAPFPIDFPWQASQAKTLFKNDGSFKKLGVHKPQKPEPKRLADQIWVNGSLKRLPEPFLSGFYPLVEPYGGVSAVQMNHYALRSARAFLVKSARGLPNRTKRALDAAYWNERNFNIVEDRSILRHEAAMLERRDELLSNAELRRLHDQSLAWHRAKADEMEGTLSGLHLLNSCMLSEARVLSPDEAQILHDKRNKLNSRLRRKDETQESADKTAKAVKN